MNILNLIFLITISLYSMTRMDIPRAPVGNFIKEGIFEGGTQAQANLENIRIGVHEEFERWVFDFSDIRLRKIGAAAPHFQVRFISGETPKFMFTFQAIDKVFVNKKYLQSLLKKSKFVKDIIVYPAIEHGDIAIEFILNQEKVEFYPHQPLEPYGKLVIDLKKYKL